MSILNSNVSGFVMSSPQNGHGGALFAFLADVTITFSDDNRLDIDGLGGGAISIHNGTLTIN